MCHRWATWWPPLKERSTAPSLLPGSAWWWGRACEAVAYGVPDEAQSLTLRPPDLAEILAQAWPRSSRLTCLQEVTLALGNDVTVGQDELELLAHPTFIGRNLLDSSVFPGKGRTHFASRE